MAGNSSSLTFKLFGRDVSASKAFRGVEKTGTSVSRSIGGMGTAFAGIGTAAAIAGVAIAVDFGKQSVDAFTEAQAKSAAFDDAMGRFKGLATYKGALDDLSQSLALKTRFDDDETKAAIATLARYDLTGKQLQTLTPLVQDYAAATGKDLTTASTLVGKAMLGNAKALKELGINFKPTGDKAKDFAKITQLLREKVGGFAEKEGKTAAGTSKILANQFGEVKEKVGSYLVPALTFLGRLIIEKVIPAIQIAVDWLSKNLGPVIKNVAAWITNVAWPALQKLADAFMKNVWPAIQQVAGMIAENLQPVISALSDFWTNTLAPAISDLAPILQKVATWVGVVVGALLVAVTWIVGKVVPVWLKVLGPAIKVVITILGKVVDAIQWVIDHFGDLIAFVKKIPGWISDAFKGLVAIITAPFRAAFNGIASLWNNTVGSLSFSVPDWVPGMGGKGFDVPDIPQLAKGGIVTRPTLALIGEAGPEAVVPLGRGGGMGTTVNVYVQGDTDPAGAARRIGELLDKGIANGSWRPNRLAVR